MRAHIQLFKLLGLLSLGAAGEAAGLPVALGAHGPVSTVHLAIALNYTMATTFTTNMTITISMKTIFTI